MTSLDELNKQIMLTYNPSRFGEYAIDCVMPGFFSGSDILFVAQNPGQLKDSVEDDIHFLNAYKEKDFSSMQLFYEKALRSEKRTYGSFIRDVYGSDWTNISFTNVIKCPFKDNIIPVVDNFEIEYSILKQQIELLQPKKIVAVGKVAQTAFSELGIDALGVFHPSYLRRTGKYKSHVEQIKKALSTY